MMPPPSIAFITVMGYSVKVWRAQTGALLFSLRGHEGDITMLDVNKVSENTHASKQFGVPSV
jgi:hypothetical protein